MGLDWPAKAVIEPPREAKFGDVAANLALVAAQAAGIKPRELAEKLKSAVLAKDPSLESVEVAGPGFLNFRFRKSFWQAALTEIHAQGEDWGRVRLGNGAKVQVEYVSANPTGPLHIGHGRGAAVGDSLARILRAAGYEVSTEYYINDAGRQMRLLGLSVWLRYRELCGESVEWPEDYYHGGYIVDLAKELLELKGRDLLELAHAKGVELCRVYGEDAILSGIKKDLSDFRVEHEVWFRESSMLETGMVQRTLDALKQAGLAYEQDGALWFASSTLGDDKDRVLRKSSGDLTYFASDIAYHAQKFKRGFQSVVDIWGADHHGYIGRMKAAVSALGRNPDDLKVVLVQLVNLLRAGEPVAMSTRSGEFETLSDVIAEVGVDAARFMFLSRKSDSHLDFDLELVKQQSMDNPVYYVQYGHARICSVYAKAAERGIEPGLAGPETLALLDSAEDMDILKQLDEFPDAVAGAAAALSPHVVSFYLRELAAKLHRYYSAHQVLAAERPELVQARLYLLGAVRLTLARGLDLLGVHAPQRM